MPRRRTAARESAPAAEPAAIARDAVERVRQVATLPEAATRIARLARDPALCAHLLKIANSAFYGLRSRVTGVEHAVALLGSAAVRNVARAASLAQVFRGGTSPPFSLTALWRHSVGVAAACRWLARERGVGDPEEAFVAGLLHDIGMVVELQADRGGFAAALQEGPVGGADLCAAERRHLGADHAQFGAALCESWGLPSSLCRLVAHHHDPQGLGAAERAAGALVPVAEGLAVRFEHGIETAAPEPDRLDPERPALLGLDRAELGTLLEPLGEAIEQAEAVFGGVAEAGGGA